MSFFPGDKYIITFIMLSIVFVFAVGFYDILLEEVYKPTNDILQDSLNMSMENYSSSEYKTLLDNNESVALGQNIPYNLLYIFMFLYSFLISIINVMGEKKKDIANLLFKTIGGVIFFFFLLQSILFSLIEYLEIEILNYLFEDLILTYIPAYNIFMDNSAYILLGWALILIVVNHYLGKDEDDNDRLARFGL